MNMIERSWEFAVYLLKCGVLVCRL